MSNENEFLQIVVKNIIRSEVLVFRIGVRGLCSGVFWRLVFFTRKPIAGRGWMLIGSSRGGVCLASGMPCHDEKSLSRRAALSELPAHVGVLVPSAPHTNVDMRYFYLNRSIFRLARAGQYLKRPRVCS